MTKLKKFLLYVVPYWGRGVLSVVFHLLGTVSSLFSFTMAIPFLGILFDTREAVAEPTELEFSAKSIQHNFNYFITQVIEEQGAHQALMIVSLMVVFFVFLKSLFVYIANHVITPLRNGVLQDVRNALYSKIVCLPMSYFSSERKGDIISRIIGDVKEMESTLVQSINKAIKSPIQLLIYLGSLFIMSYQLTIFVLVLLPISGFFISRVAKRLRKQATKGQERLGILLTNVEETLFGMRIIKAFGAEERVTERFFHENQRFTSMLNKVWRRKFLAHPISEFMGTVVIVVVMWFGGSMVLNNESPLSPQEFMTYLIIFSQIIPPSKSISNIYFDFQKGMASFDRVDELLSAEITIQNPPNPKPIERFRDRVEFRNVNFAYTDTLVLEDINLTIKKGHTVALVGQSGAGKSTLVDLIPRFYDPAEGDILIDGHSIKDYDIKALRKLIGVVSQEQILFNDTIYNNIAFGTNHVAPEDVERAARIANAHAFIQETEQGYQTNIGDRGNKLSGGQRQRVTIARAILKNPDILILDEATSSLDTESEKQVQNAMEKLLENRTSFVIAHRLSTIQRADVICVLHEGRIRETGTHKELIARGGMYKQLHDIQFSGS